MSRHQDSGKSDSANLGTCREVLVEGFDGDERALLVVQLKKPLRIDGVLRNYAGIVLEQAQLEQMARGVMRLAKRKARQFSMVMPGLPGTRLVKPVRFVP